MLEALDNPDERRLTQRQISALSGISPSVVNQYLNDFEQADWIERTSLNGRDVQYVLTDQGRDVLREMMVAYVRETFQLFSAGKAELTEILRAYEREYAIERLIFYSAGEVTELLLHPLQETSMALVAVADDDPDKQGSALFGYPLIAPESIADYAPDAVMVTTFRYRDAIHETLDELNLGKITVIDF
ncbi:MAG: winged helix-turn-helix transcriptional regulator [Salinibacter sp.]